MAESIYVITHYAFNHGRDNPQAQPLDERFLTSSHNFIYYLIDEEVPPCLREKRVVREKDLDPLLCQVGKDHLGEWSFLLQEEKLSFCEYPFFMVSSRFYQKNTWLKQDLSSEWERLFCLFNTYRYGYLPCYDRPLRWLNLKWEKKLRNKEWRHLFFPWKEETFSLIASLFGIQIPEKYSAASDLQCNYIGFKDRKALLDYIAYYRPLIEFFFDPNYALRCSLDPYVRKTGSFRNEKPMALLLEFLAHLSFFKSGEKIFALHYDGYYEVDESKRQFRKLSDHSPPLLTRLEQLLRWQWRRSKTEGLLAPWHARKNSLYRSTR